jgi:hypothetical protein
LWNKTIRRNKKRLVPVLVPRDFAGAGLERQPEICDRNPAASGILTRMNSTSIIEQFFEPVAEILPTETARQLVDLRLNPQLQARLDELAAKANLGQLTESERVEYEEYVEGLDVIAIFKAQARAALRRRGA